MRRAIETHQPMLGVHGHIHESQGVATIGRTICINPGSEYGEGILRGCLVTFAGGKVEGYQMTSRDLDQCWLHPQLVPDRQ